MLNENYCIYNLSSTIRFTNDTNKDFDTKFYFEENSVCLSNDLWWYISNLTNHKKINTFTLLHIFESHTPYSCGYHEKPIMANEPVDWYLNYGNKGYSSQNIKEQYEECLIYIDKQLQFFLNLLPSEVMKIILGDHGQLVGEYGGIGQVLTWYEESIHVPFIINWEALKPVKYENLFSMLGFGNQLMHILKNHCVEEEKIKYIEVQRDPVYNPGILGNKIVIDKIGDRRLKAFKLARRFKDKYILYEDGAEEYYVLPDETINLIKEKKYYNEICDIKKHITNENFPKFDEKPHNTNGRYQENYSIELA